MAMMKLRHVILTMALAIAMPSRLPGQILDQIKKPPDYTKQADVNGKNAELGNLNYSTVPQSSRAFTTSAPLSQGDLHLQRANLSELKLNSVDMPTVSEPMLPQVNFTAKRAVADKDNDRASVQADETKQKAPITSRQIRALTPAGEKELKKQLNAIHP